MARHPTAHRVHREHVAPDDAFLEGALKTTAFVQQNRRLLITAVVSVVVLGLLLFVWRNNTRRLTEAAAVEILQVRQTAQSGNPALTIRDTEAFLDRFGSTPSAVEAKLLLGQAYLESNQAQPAIDAVRDLAGNLSTPSGISAAMLTAAAHEAAARFDEAEQILLRIADRAEFDYQKTTALDNAARIRLERGQPAAAADLYDRILQLLPTDSQDRPVFEMRRAEARAATSTS
jgi:predicted negative regulator of RcsB-dependent stress response